MAHGNLVGLKPLQTAFDWYSNTLQARNIRTTHATGGRDQSEPLRDGPKQNLRLPINSPAPSMKLELVREPLHLKSESMTVLTFRQQLVLLLARTR